MSKKKLIMKETHKQKDDQKYFIVDNVIIGNNHITNNAGCINIVQRLSHASTHIRFFAEKKHIENIRPLVSVIPGKPVQFEAIRVVDPSKPSIQKAIAWARKLKADSSFLQGLFKLAQREKPEFILFCTIAAINLYLHINLIRKFRHQKVIIGLHGEIEYLFRTDISNKDKLNAFLYKKAFASTPDNLKYLVLSPLIKEKIVQSGYLQADQILSIEHPINQADTYIKQASSDKPVFAFLGVASLRKSADKLFALANECRTQTENNLASFQIIGKLSDDVLPYSNNNVLVGSKDGKPLPQNRYQELIKSSTYSLSFISGENYLYRISGSIIDSIQYHLPLIALKHEFITHLFREAGDIGFICEDLEEMSNVVKEIAVGKRAFLDRYDEQVTNLSLYANRFSAQENARNLRTQLAQISWLSES